MPRGDGQRAADRPSVSVLMPVGDVRPFVAEVIASMLAHDPHELGFWSKVGIARLIAW